MSKCKQLETVSGFGLFPQTQVETLMQPKTLCRVTSPTGPWGGTG